MKKDDPAAALKAALTGELHIDPASGIDVRAEGEALVIEGTVDGIALKKRALLIAMRTPGVEGVVDRLRVRPSMPMTDGEIRNHLTRALSEEPVLKGTEIRVEIRDSVVDLEGRVGSLTHKRIAGVLAWWVPGSTEVINSIEVVPPEEDTDDEVTDAVRAVLEKDRLVDESSIGVSTRDWVVTLTGSVPAGAQKKMAEEDAWYVWGVNEVINEIEAG